VPSATASTPATTSKPHGKGAPRAVKGSAASASRATATAATTAAPPPPPPPVPSSTSTYGVFE
jgi:hypothetical protein